MLDPPLPTNQQVMAIHQCQQGLGSALLAPPVESRRSLGALSSQLFRSSPRVPQKQQGGEVSRYDRRPQPLGRVRSRDLTSKAVLLS